MEVEPVVLSSFPEPRPVRVQGVDDEENEALTDVEEDFEADSFVSTNVPDAEDELLKEQTWPTDDEIRSAPANVKIHSLDGATSLDADSVSSKKTKKVPKGWSSYQAAWIPDDEEVEEFMRHKRGTGEDEDYVSPERPLKRLRLDGVYEEDVADKRRVKWDRGLETAVLLDDIIPRTSARKDKMNILE